MFRLTPEESEMLVSQNVIPSIKYIGGYLPYVFTQEGIAMLSSVLTSPRAVKVNIAIMRAFVRVREILLTHKDLAAKIEALEFKYKSHDGRLSEHDAHIAAIFEAIKQLMAPPQVSEKPRIGFK